MEQNHTLQVLAYDPHRPLVPKLEHIVVDGSETTIEIDMNQFTWMIKSRWWSDAHADAASRGLSRLRLVEVYYCSELESALQDQWNVSREQGLEIIQTPQY